MDAAPPARCKTIYPSYVPVSAELLKRLYVDERLTAADISARIGCSPITILRRLRQFGIPARPRGPLHQAKTLNGDINWSANLAWAVGLIATDGNLSGDGRHMAVTSIDRDVLETLRACLNLSVAITPHYGGHGHRGLRVQWGDRHFYDWLLDVGLTPTKSLTLRPLAIPDAVFADFVRGCIDGDGSVTVYVDTYNTDKSERYVYERLYVKLVSASHLFLDVNSRLICATFSLPECATCWGTVSARVNPDRGGKESAISHGAKHDQVPEAEGAVQDADRPPDGL